MKKILSIFFILAACHLQAGNLKVCRPYTTDNQWNLHVQYPQDQDAKLKKCIAVLKKGYRMALYVQHPLELLNVYAERLLDDKFMIHNVDKDTKTITWVWLNTRDRFEIADQVRAVEGKQDGKLPAYKAGFGDAAVRVVLKNKDGKVLLTKDKDVSWLLVPGSGLEKYAELPRHGAVRNLAKELGVTIHSKDLKLVGLLTRANAYGCGKDEVVYLFTAERYEGDVKVKSGAVEKFLWATPEEIKQGAVDGTKVHPFTVSLVDQAIGSRAKEGYIPMPDLSAIDPSPDQSWMMSLFARRDRSHKICRIGLDGDKKRPTENKFYGIISQDRPSPSL